MTSDRDRLRRTFDAAADHYQVARPEYPTALFDALVEDAGLRVGDLLLEVGCATGKATVPLARRGFRILALDIGAELVAAARRTLASFPEVQVVEAEFETWYPRHPQKFHLVYAATAWHWIDPGVRYRRAWEVLRPNGHLAFWSATHAFPDGGDPFFVEIQDVYDAIEGNSAGAAALRPRPGELPDQREEIENSGLFTELVVRQFDWEISYDADQYIALLDTFSGHIAMAASERAYLYGEIRRRLAERPDGRLRRHWGAVLHVARRVD